MICDQCSDETPADEIHEHGGMNLCDDCYMDAMQPATGCNPWAIYLATRTQTEDSALNKIQRTILDLVEKRGRVAIPDLLEATGLDLEGLRKEIVPLRHMEKVIWERQADQSPLLKRFE